MTKRIWYIIIGAILLVGVVALLWVWFFNRESTPSTGTGTFGTAQNRTVTNSTGNSGGNGQSPYGTNVSSNPNYTYTDTAVNDAIPVTVGGSVNFADQGTYTPPGVTWFDSASLKSFNPTPINTITSVDISGLPNINNGAQNGSGGGDQSGIAAGAVACTAGLLTGLAKGAIDSTIAGVFSVQVNAIAQNSKDADTLMKDFLSCIARTIARAALQKITSSVVDWLNSGFNGQPAFVQDFQKYFLDAADKAVGQFFESNSLSFLCSPYQQQIKTAVAQSYASRRAGVAQAQSCTLSQAVGNVQAFANGDFSQGGWNGLLSYTTVPTNNVFGAYMQKEAELNDYITATQVDAARKVSDGFIAQTDSSGKIVTPAPVVEGLAQKTLEIPIDELNMAKNFDEIISSLVTQLINRAIYGGLANLSGHNGYENNFLSAQDSQALTAAQSLLTSLQSAVSVAQQYGSTQQGSIADIQNVQSALTTLENCWATAASSTSLTSGQTTLAAQNAASAETQIQNLELRVTLYNDNITHANNAIAQVQQLQTEALAATTLDDVQIAQTHFASAQASGVLVTPSDVTLAQQNRTTLQSEMDSLNQSTSAQLTQCYAFGQ